MDNNMIGRRINTLLAERNVSQRDLARALGYTDKTANTISYFCSGKRTPNVPQLKAIARYFNTTVDYLLGLTEAQTVDNNLRLVCDYTGLSQETIEALHYWGSSGKRTVVNNSEANTYTFRDYIDFLIRERETLSLMMEMYIKEAITCALKSGDELEGSTFLLSPQGQAIKDELEKHDIRITSMQRQHDFSILAAAEAFKQSVNEYVREKSKELKAVSDTKEGIYNAVHKKKDNR